MMSLTQPLLCALGCVCFILSVVEGASTENWIGDSVTQDTTMSDQELTSVALVEEHSEEWMQGQASSSSDPEVVPVVSSPQEESNSSESQQSWEVGSQEEPGQSSGNGAPSPLVPAGTSPIPVVNASTAAHTSRSSPNPSHSDTASPLPLGTEGRGNTPGANQSEPLPAVRLPRRPPRLRPAPAAPGSAPVITGSAPVPTDSAPVTAGPAPVATGSAPVASGPVPVPTGSAPAPTGPHGDLSSDSGEAADRPTSEWPAFGHGDGQGTTPSVGVTAAGPVLSVPGSTASRPPPLTVAPGTDERVVGFVPVLSTVVGGNDASSPPATTTGWSEPPVTFPSSAAEDTGARTAETEFVPGDRGSAAASELPLDTTQVVCVDWSKLAGKSYIILNLTENTECEVFRSRNGLKLLKMVAGAFSGTLSTPEELWHISLSSEDDQHLLMMLATDRGIIPAKEVLSTLGDIKQNLKEIGVHNVTFATGCQGRPSQSRGDYGKLFVVLVIIGSICVVIIVSGLIYICWQRRLPKLKNMSLGEELHFVENGCHDNPTLDITIDSTSEMQEKKPSVNGDAIDGSGGWNALINKRSKDDPDNFEEDTHL
ncbi:podocalyxin-like protein 2 [Callorhinchus milii]|nr:podocalyxin-like protein 2 [Callorhinchus milii]